MVADCRAGWLSLKLELAWRAGRPSLVTHPTATATQNSPIEPPWLAAAAHCASLLAGVVVVVAAAAAAAAIVANARMAH